MKRIGLVLLMLMGVLATALPGARADESIQFEKTDLVIATAAGDEHRFTVEIAETTRQRSRGLMFRESLAPDQGMLFVYPGEQEIRMWMRNTLIPLDMLFVALDGTIVSIAADTVPLSEEIVSSGAAARGVIELAGGTARRLDIQPGDKVRHPLFGG